MDEKIFELLDEIKSLIKNNKFDEDEKENIYSSLNSFINKDYTLDKKMLQYLITGWNVIEQFENLSNDNTLKETEQEKCID